MGELDNLTDAELRRLMTPEAFRRPERTRSYPLPRPIIVPGVVEHFTKRPHRFKCGACFRVFVGVYKPEKPLPVCMGGGREGLHARMMLVSEIWDEYQHMCARFDRGDPTTRPIIQPRNAHKFEVQRPAESIRDLGRPTSSPRG